MGSHDGPCRSLKILLSFQRELRDLEQAAQDLADCGPTVLRLVSDSVTSLLLYLSPPSHKNCNSSQHNLFNAAVPADSRLLSERIRLSLQTVFTLAQQHIKSIPFNLVPRRWLRLYTDASILMALCDLEFVPGDGKPEKEKLYWRDVVRRLDMAIIVAGAIGEDRAEWIRTVIKEVQARDASLDDSQPERPLKRARLVSTSDDALPPHKDSPSSSKITPSKLLYAPNPVTVLSSSPSMTKYTCELHTQPFIIPGFFSNPDSPSFWPATQRWKLVDYLLNKVGPGRVVPVEMGGAYDDSDWGQSIIPFAQFLRRAGFHADDEEISDPLLPDATPLYLAQYGLFLQFPELLQDIAYPDYVWSSPPAPESYPAYKPPETEDGVIVNVWVGSGSGEIISPAHTDPYFNCYAQVLGHKRIWLAPPASGPHMYAYGGSDPTATLSTDGTNDSDDASHIEQYMTNTSTIPIMRPIEDFETLSPKFPAFFRHVRPQSLEAVLNPGDLLVMPPGWWHAMRGEGNDPVWSVSMWY